MSFKQILIARILLTLAQMFAEDDALRNELKNLSNHISVNGKEEK